MPLSDDTGTGSEQSGFLDVAANALAVMILATMMLLAVASPIRLAGEVVPDEQTPTLNFPRAVDPLMRPLFAYYFVTKAGVTPIDLDALARAVAETGGDAQTEQGRVRITVPRRARRDWNEYRARFVPDLEALRKNARPIGETDRAALLERLRQDYERHGSVATWLVAPDAIAAAAPLYWGLREAGVPVRWHIADTNAEIRFERSAQLFERPGALD